MSYKTFEEPNINNALYSNQVWLCDQIKLDILLVGQHTELLERPYLTKITDSYSRCIMGIHLSFDTPSSSQVVALALHHAILPKQYGAEYKLNCEWGTYCFPENLVTDSGKYFRSKNFKQIALQLALKCHVSNFLTRRGIEESSFWIIDREFLSQLPGYLGSNIQEHRSTAQGTAYLTLQELELRLVRYIVDVYNQQPDDRTQDQARFQR